MRSAGAGWHHQRGLWHLTPAGVYSAFIDFSQNVTVTLTTNSKKEVEGTAEIAAAYPDLGRPPGHQEPFTLWTRQKGHAPPAEQLALQTLTPASVVVGRFSFYIAAPRSLSSLHRPGRVPGWDRFNSRCFGAVHSPPSPPCRLPASAAEGAAKPGAGGGEEGWEALSPRRTTEANALCNLILLGWGFLKMSSFAAKTCF